MTAPSPPESPAFFPAALLAGASLPLPTEAVGERLDRFLATVLKTEGVSREKVKEWIKAGCVLLDGEPCRTPRQSLTRGMLLRLSNLPEIIPTTCAPAVDHADALRMLHVDDDILVVEKPAGLTVHPAPSCREETLVHRLLARYPDLAAMGTERPGVVHRIDKDTSGLLVVARHEKARQTLAAAFEQRQVDKAYLAICHGVPQPTQDRIDAPMGRHPTRKTCMAVVPKGGRPAVSEYRVLHADPDGRWALVLVVIHTGRTHQIRVHMRHIGHPLLGDGLYGGQVRRPGDLPAMRTAAARRQMLHAWRTAFAHPADGRRMAFLSPLPREMRGTLLRLSRRCQRVIITGLPGCGKSAVTAGLADAGVPVFSADACVAELYTPGADGYSMLTRRYGDRFLDENERLDRRALFAAMRETPGLRQEVEAMIHPMVKTKLDAFWTAHAACPLAVAEIPLALEAGWETGSAAGSADLLVGVHCDRAERHARLRQSRGWNDAQIAAMEAWQWGEAAKLGRCHLVVDNTGAQDALPGRVRALRRTLAGLRATRARREWRRLALLLQTR
ncbi:dephospho-CoA kinase [Megalodesulfovibrio gigas]|uniref:Dephospho-CoA kinase n=1 Tax=Megalodesulfovibrio gigas (strain ATCC 19364 / DSM 1382 / NCIMB 9332 / VKM B-1759) TaxID=1121448 RepID=T2GEN7_MEGG1|nr:dephospho-CoA kinase [Megalodesulfovibrio gigas]AGW14624.1 putative dephospho-CoA kinase / ribosomal large subunit pseudouridine synthase D [Megalodesulfovibrio gigas DSM 1382 = ATCC 19364]